VTDAQASVDAASEPWIRCRTWWVIAAVLAASLSGAGLAAGQPVSAPAVTPATVEWPRASTLGDRYYVTTPGDDLKLEPPLELVPVAEGELDRDALARGEVTTLRGFDEARYGLAELSVFFRRVPMPDERQTDTLDILVSARGAGGAVRWWRLAFAAGENDQWFLRTDAIDPDPSQPAGQAAPALTPQAYVATPDASLPLIGVEFPFNPTGQRQTTHHTTHLLLDFRGSTPKVAATLERMSRYDCIGACAAYDCGLGAHLSVACRWDPDATDFACAEQFTEGRNDGAERTGTRWFRLLSGSTLPSPRAKTGPLDSKPGVPVAGARAGYTQPLERLGPVTLAGVFDVGGGRVWLLGLPKLKPDFDVDFAIAPVKAGVRGPIQAIGSRFDVRSLPLDANNERAVWEPHQDEAELYVGYTPDVAPAFRVSPMITAGALTIVRVLVSEGETRTVHLVGVERTPAGLVADVLPIATSGSTYAACAYYLRPAAAVGLTVARTPLRVTLDVEPAYYWSVAAEEDEVEPPEHREDYDCRARVVMTWAAVKGFEPVSRERRCGEPPRRVVIAADGTLSSRPMKKAEPRGR
jgi:hypothetical protein